MKYVASILLAAAFASVASAAPPEVPKELPAKVGEISTFDVKFDQAKGFAWTPGFDKAKCQVVRLHSDDPMVASYMVIPKEPGDYYLSFITVGEKSFTQLVVKAGGLPPPVPPPVPPGPNPPVPPVPVGIGAYVIAIVDESAPTQLQTLVANGHTLSALKAAGKCRVYGTISDADKIAAKRYDKMLVDFKLKAPALFVLDKDGKVILPSALPASDADTATLLKGVITP